MQFLMLSQLFLRLFFFFFFLMIRRPPRSTLFPTRRSSDLTFLQPTRAPAWLQPWSWTSARRALHRSEEHTSELQSRQYLVCRLLLEKKKKKTTTVSQREGHALSIDEQARLRMEQDGAAVLK